MRAHVWKGARRGHLKGTSHQGPTQPAFLQQNQVSSSYLLLKGQSELEEGLLNEKRLSTKIMSFLCMFVSFFFRGLCVLFQTFDLAVHTILRRRGFMPPWNLKPTLLLQRYNLENMLQDVPKLIDDSD